MKLKLFTIFFFTTTFFFGQNTIVTMQDESIFVCSGFFYDSEARNNGNYEDNENYTITLYPAVSNMKLKLIFNSFSTENNFDGMMIYNGNSTTAPLISSGLSAGLDPITCPAGAWRGNGSPGTIISTATDGSLTIVFKSNSDNRRTGWEASISLVGNSCNSSYVDFGGNNFDYWNNVNDQITLYPSSNSEKVQIVFTSFSTENNFDGMMIYDGNSTTAPLISSGLPAGLDPITCPAGAWRGSGSPGAITSTATDGSLTIVFKSDDSSVSAGWTANINCIINPPTSISISETSGLANNDGTICSGASTTLTANGAIGTVYWYTNSCGGTQIGTGNSITVTPPTTTTYYARNNNNGGWSTCLTSTVSVTPAPANVNAGNDVSICSGASTQLSGSSSSVLLCTNTSTLTNTTNYSVPDNNAMGGSSIINVSSSCGTAAEIVSVKVNINHLWVQDLDISLIAPNGSTINLSSDNGSSGTDYINTVFTASGLIPITLGSAPFSGNYIPEEPFTNLTGSAVGNWTLKVVDDEYLLGGTIINWSIVVKTNQNAIVTYSWSPTTGLNNPNIANPIASPTSTTTYTMTATSNGCSNSDAVVVNVNPLPQTPNINHN